LIVIDEKRVQEQRRDWLFCFAAPNRETQTEIVAADKPLADRVMLWYANKLLRPWVKALVLIVFAGLLGGLAYSATKFEESFNFKDVLPSDSYLQGYFNSIEDYSSRSGVAPDVYFRFVDQGDPEIQAAMESYVNDLVNGLQEVSDQPTE
jgi:Niemann-Pick C1 protein